MADEGNVDAALRRLQSHPGVVGYLILNENGIILRQHNLSAKEATQMAGLIHHLVWETSDFIRKSPYPGATNSSQGAGSASSTLPAYHTGLQLAIQNAMSPESALGTAADDHVVCIRLHTYKREIIICPAYASDEKEGGASGQKEGETKPTDVQGQLQGPASTAGQNAQQQARIKDDVRYTLIVVQQTPYGQKVAAEEKAAAARAAAASGTSAAAGDGDEGK